MSVPPDTSSPTPSTAPSEAPTGSRIPLWLLVLVVLTATGAFLLRDKEGDDTPVVPDMPVPTLDASISIPVPGEHPDSNAGGTVLVEHISVSLLESFPQQAHVHVQGHLSDSCTIIDDSTSRRVGRAFFIAIDTAREKDALCTQALVPFTRTVPLDIFNLPQGRYVVQAGDTKATFTLDTHNTATGDVIDLSPERLLGEDDFPIEAFIGTSPEKANTSAEAVPSPTPPPPGFLEVQ